MSTTERIKGLNDSITNEYLNDFKLKLNEVVSMGESEIEKLMILQLFNYFQKFGNDKCIDYSYYGKVEFIEEEIDIYYSEISEIEKLYLKEKIQKYNYRFNTITGKYYKFCGFKVSKNILVHNSINGPVILDIEICPQTIELVGNSYKRIDIGIVLKQRAFISNNVVETKKIAIECDGFEHHSTRQQFINDKIRERELLAKGWRNVFRYSGSEIYNINDDLKKTHYQVEQIINTLLL